MSAEPCPAPGPLSDADRALCHVQAAWLRAVLQAAPLAWLLEMVCLLCWLVLGSRTAWLLWGMLLLALVERWHALRLRLDADLFDRLGQGHVASTAALQSALHRLQLKRLPPDAAPRALADMLRGCQRLVWRYALCVLVLMLLTGGAVYLAARH